jgi:hypothetical protein
MLAHIILPKVRKTSEDAINDVFPKPWKSMEMIRMNTSLQTCLYNNIYNYCTGNLKHIQFQEKYKTVFSSHAQWMKQTATTS